MTGTPALAPWAADPHRGARAANVTVVTADVNDYPPPAGVDRVVSTEMFEHMANRRALLARVREWLTPDGGRSSKWRWSGEHDRRAADDRLRGVGRQGREIEEVLRSHHGAAAPLWRRRRRLFFPATAGLFGSDGGRAWGIGHYRLRSVP